LANVKDIIVLVNISTHRHPTYSHEKDKSDMTSAGDSTCYVHCVFSTIVLFRQTSE